MQLEEVQSLNIKEVLRYKAIEAYRLVNKPVLVEDTSLTFTALGKLPGTFIKWFETLGNESLCRLLDAYNDRSAIYTIGFAMNDGKEVKTITVSSRGSIALHPQGVGYGWNTIFMYQGLQSTIAELTEEEKQRYSTRMKAIKKLEELLRSQLI